MTSIVFLRIYSGLPLVSTRNMLNLTGNGQRSSVSPCLRIRYTTVFRLKKNQLSRYQFGEYHDLVLTPTTPLSPAWNTVPSSTPIEPIISPSSLHTRWIQVLTVSIPAKGQSG